MGKQLTSPPYCYSCTSYHYQPPACTSEHSASALVTSFNPPLASAVAVWSPLAMLLLLLLLLLVDLALWWLLLAEWTDDGLWWRKTPGAMGLEPSGALTASVPSA